MFSRKAAGIIIIVAVGLLFPVFGSVSPRAQGVLEDCAADVTTYCADVELGHGRVLSCLYAHEDKISDACYAATIDYHDAMDFMFASVRETLAACAADIGTHCAGTEFGHGRILTCLSENKTEIAPACKKVIDRIPIGLPASE